MAALLRKIALVVALAGIVGFVIGSTLARGATLPENSLWHYVHPNSKALVGAQWSKVQKSELGRWLERRWIKDLTMPGVEFLKDVEEVLISSPGPKSGSEEDEDPALMIAIRGNFNLTRVRLVLARQGARMQSFDGVPIFRLKGKSPSEPAFALLNPQTILVAEPQSLFSTIERSKLIINTEEAGTFTARAQSLAARYDCWAVADDNGSIHNFLLSGLMGKTLSPDSQGFEAGISVKDGLVIDVMMRVRTERAAKLLQNNLSRMIGLAASQTSSNNGADFLKLVPKFRITSDKSSVSLSLRMSSTEVAASLHGVPENRVAQNTQVTGEAERKVEPSPPPPPPQKLVIRIEGLDDGPRELLYKP